MKILNFGSCNIDYVYSLDHIVKIGETETSDKLELFPGGKGLNQSIAAAKAGVEVYHAGCIGHDGEILFDILSQNGVNTAYIRRTEGKSGHAIIQVGSGGENSIFIYSGANAEITTEYIDSVLCEFDEGDILILQNEIVNIPYIIKRAAEKRMVIMFNPSPINSVIDEIDFGDISYLILNEVEANTISGCADTEQSLMYLKQKYPKLKIMLTLGSDGCVYSDGEIELFQSAFRVKTVDTTAAGDTFTGYFAAEISRGTEYPQILKIASAASAIAVSRNGAAPSIPDKNEVLSALEHLTENTPDKKVIKTQEAIRQYIKQHPKDGSLSELAGILGYSTNYTGSLVKKHLGTSFSDAIQTERCRIAAELLSSTDLKISDISEYVGYENVTFFRQIFSKKYGKSPSKYKKS